MTTVDDAWDWYVAAKEQLGLLRRLGEASWNELPDGLPLFRHDRYRELTAQAVTDAAAAALGPLDDLAVLVLFSTFEAVVRSAVLAAVEPEAERITHPTLRRAVMDARRRVEEGSFFTVLDPFKADGLADLIEEVNQVRRYRNWVAHGRRGVRPAGVTPEAAYDRLSEFLRRLVLAPPPNLEP